MPVRLNLPKPNPLRESTQGRRVRIRGFRSTSHRAGLVTGTRSAYAAAVAERNRSRAGRSFALAVGSFE
jgi:hypothetical protein